MDRTNKEVSKRVELKTIIKLGAEVSLWYLTNIAELMLSILMQSKSSRKIIYKDYYEVLDNNNIVSVGDYQADYAYLQMKYGFHLLI